MNRLLKRIILTRPYSWVGVILVGVLANVMATNAFVWNNKLFFDIFTSFVIWCTATLIAEYFHGKIDMRGLINPLLPLFSIIILVIVIAVKNALALVLLPVIIVADVAYSSKIKNWLLSRFSFMFRGILEVCIFIIILLFHFKYNIGEFAIPLLVIYFLVNSRNLIGDIRDADFDEYTFPKKHGIRSSYAVSIVLILISVMLLPDFMIMLPLILFILSIPLFRNAYILHRIFVVSTTFFYMNYILSILEQSLIFTNILFIAVLLNFTYPIVPRKSNPRTTQVYNYQNR